MARDKKESEGIKVKTKQLKTKQLKTKVNKN